MSNFDNSAYVDQFNKAALARIAISAVNSAIASGKMMRLDTCQICGDTPANTKRPAIVGHHWQGYDYPLDVWWICRPCNRFLSGEKYHNGTFNLEQVRKVVHNHRHPQIDADTKPTPFGFDDLKLTGERLAAFIKYFPDWKSKKE